MTLFHPICTNQKDFCTFCIPLSYLRFSNIFSIHKLNITKEVAYMDNDIKVEKECSSCHGHGKIDNKDCTVCNGTGVVLTEEGLKILNYLRNSIRISEH